MRYIFFAGFLFYFFTGSIALGALSSSVGKRPSSIKSLTLAQVAGKLIMMQMGDQEKSELYRVLRSADREKGARNTIQLLLRVIKLRTTDLPDNFDEIDWFGFAIEALFLGSLQRLLMHKEHKEDEHFAQLVVEIEDMKDMVFYLLQDQALSGSPRGSKDEIIYSKQKKSLFIVKLDFDLAWLRTDLDYQLYTYLK